MKKNAGHRRTLRFCRWSRKGYAIFVSLGRCVTIGRLCREIADRSLCKQQNALSIALLFGQPLQQTEESDVFAPEMDLWVDLQGITMPFLQPIFALRSTDYQEYINYTRFS